MKRSRDTRAAVPAIIALALWGAGCASYSQHALPVREPLRNGDFAAAQAFLEDKTNKIMELYSTLKRVIYVVGGIGIIILALFAFFGRFKWQHFWGIVGGFVLVAY